MRSPIAGITVAILLLAGCKSLPTVKVDLEAPDLPKAADAFRQGLEGMDPIGFQKILKENEELRNTIASIQLKLSGVTAGSPVIVLSGRKLRIEVTQYTGDFLISGWVDTRANWFWQDRRFDRKDITLPINYEKVAEDLLQELKPQGKFPSYFQSAVTSAAEVTLGKRRDLIADRYRQATTAAFAEFLRSSALVPGPDERFIDLRSSLLTVGNHTVTVEIRPIAGDSSARWALRGHVVSVAPNGDLEKIKEFDVDSNNPRYAGHSLGAPLDLVNAMIVVVSTE